MKSSRALDVPLKACWLVHGGSFLGVCPPSWLLSLVSFVIPLGVAACLWFPATLPAATQPHTNGSSHANYDASQDFFTNGVIPHLVIEIKGTNLANLERNDRVSVRATVRDGNTVYEDVGIHVKGAAGSRRSLNENPALTLNFDKFQEHQKFHGLDKIHLNNSVQDGSLMTELLCGYLFRAAGVPAARTTHARVRLNGRDLGLYVLKEGFNKSFLRQYFKNVNGNLYDGGFLREISEPLQQMLGSETNGYAPLKAVVAAAQEPDHAKRMQRLERGLDLDRFISLMAMEVMTWHWDGYAMKRNNYRVYHDPDTDKIVFFAHGMDQMFWEANGPILPPVRDGLVARSIWETTSGRRLYRERVGFLLTNVFKLEMITNLMNQVQARIRPELVAISPNRAREQEGAVNNLRNQIIARAKSIAQQLEVPEAKPLQLDTSGRAIISQWREINRLNNATMESVAHEGKPRTLHIGASGTGDCISSWRKLVLLEPGQYRFECMLSTSGVVPLKDKKGEGAGVRISRATTERPNSAVGDTPWHKVEYDFPVPSEPQEIDLICELRAISGDAWFDLESLQLIRKTGR